MARPAHRPSLPSTNPEPIMKQLFDEQDRLGITTLKLAMMTGIYWRTLSKLRHPMLGGGVKNASIYQARIIASALGFVMPTQLDPVRRKQEEAQS